jgi:hypothetical protein
VNPLEAPSFCAPAAAESLSNAASGKDPWWRTRKARPRFAVGTLLIVGYLAGRLEPELNERPSTDIHRHGWCGNRSSLWFGSDGGTGVDDTRSYFHNEIAQHFHCAVRILGVRPVAAGVEHHETEKIGADAVREHAGEHRWAPRILPATDNQRRTLYAVKERTKVEPLALTLKKMDRHQKIVN